MIKVYVISLGCPKNRVDSERLLGAIKGGARPVDDPGNADLALINTCGFIRPAVEESVRAVLETIEGIRGANQRPVLAVTGCLVSRYGKEELAADLPEVDLWLSTREMDDWPEMIAGALGIRPTSGMGARAFDPGPGYAYLKISEGCAHKCAFCVIPMIRGPLQSAAMKTLEIEARELVERGAKELVLVAQDVTEYGADMGDGTQANLIRLLERLLVLDGLEWLRLMYLYPAGLTDELLSFMARAGPPLLPYIDVPLQHAHPDILKKMGRPFAGDPDKVLRRVREHLPESVVRTSIIVGFPGEEDHHFAALCDFVRKSRFDHLGVFTYWPEEGSRAAGMAGQVPGPVMRARRDELMEIQAGISADKLSLHVGSELDVLVERASPEWPGLYEGRAWFQAPEVDGLTYVSGPPESRKIRPGRFVKAEIVDSGDYDLTGLV